LVVFQVNMNQYDSEDSGFYSDTKDEDPPTPPPSTKDAPEARSYYLFDRFSISDL